MKTVNIRFISDPGHGWGEVERKMLHELGIAGKISQYSYQRGSKVYLEEDCDLRVLYDALKNRGDKVVFDNVYQENTPIRHYQRYQFS